jgi:hypothetical protein
MFEQAPRDLVEVGLPAALTAAAQVFEQSVIERAPAPHEGHSDESIPHVKDAVVFDVQVDPVLPVGVARIGFQGQAAHVALWLEYGHRMVGHAPGKQDLGFVEPHPFVRRAFDEGVEPAVDAFQQSISKTFQSGRIGGR